MISFFSLSLSCLNAGSRIIYPMAQHLVFPQRLGRAHATNGTPHVAITVYVVIMFLVPTVLEMNTNPLTTFGDEPARPHDRRRFSAAFAGNRRPSWKPPGWAAGRRRDHAVSPGGPGSIP